MTETRTITATKLRRDLGGVLDAVARGETINVVRHGRPLCVLSPPTTPEPPAETPAASA